jgi:hypothetical protein
VKSKRRFTTEVTKGTKETEGSSSFLLCIVLFLDTVLRGLYPLSFASTAGLTYV